MKKVLAALMCVILLLPTLVSCGGIKPNDDDRGAEIPVYLSEEIYNLDPAVAYTNSSAAKILSLIFEGLFRLDEDGKVQKALCTDYKTYTDRDGEFVAEFTLGDTKWSDDRTVSANDFVYAWKRILEPEFSSKAASMLFDVKNARACKSGDVSIDDLGVVAADTKVLQVTFEKEINIDTFIRDLASPALVPLREDKVNRLADWASYYATMATNGPFFVKIFVPGEGSMVLERSIYYYRDTEEENESLDKYVNPYRLCIKFETPEKNYENFKSENIVFDSDLPLSERANASDVETINMLSTQTYVFNTTKAPFDNASVRKALSLAIDRNEIAQKVVYADPATGIIPNGISDKSDNDSFRENGGSLIESGAKLDEAKKLISDAKVSNKDITITVRENQVDLTVAEYIKGQWEQLGFKVKLDTPTFEHYTNIEYDQYKDLFDEKYQNCDFDVIVIDSQMLSTYAFNELSSYAAEFSGMGMDLSNANFDAVSHITGYSKPDYDKLIAQAYEETDTAKRSDLLHQAEAMLVEDMPVMPVFVHKNAYVKNSSLSKLSADYFGAVLFKEAKLSGYEKYKTEE